MSSENFVVRKGDRASFQQVTHVLQGKFRASAVALLEREGQVLGQSGDLAIDDLSSFASLTCAIASASSCLSPLLGSGAFQHLELHGRDYDLHVFVLGEDWILAVVVTPCCSDGLRGPGLDVAREVLVALENGRNREMDHDAGDPLFAVLSDEDIDAWFSKTF